MRSLVVATVLGAVLLGGSTLAVFLATRMPEPRSATGRPSAGEAVVAGDAASTSPALPPGSSAPGPVASAAAQPLPSFLQPYEEDPVVAEAEVEREARQAKRAKRLGRLTGTRSPQQP
jgi:hypothetical protein